MMSTLSMLSLVGSDNSLLIMVWVDVSSGVIFDRETLVIPEDCVLLALAET